MNRACKNATRGKQKGSIPAKPKLGPAQLVSNYDGRANLAAGSFERKASGSAEAKGRIVEWKK